MPAGTGWQVDWAPDALAPDLADGDTLGLRTVPPVRGDITGADGAVLVTERPVLRYGLDKTKVEGPQVARSARRIARVLDVDVASYVERAEVMGAEAFVEALVLREDDALDVLPGFAKIRGAARRARHHAARLDARVRRGAARPRRPGHGSRSSRPRRAASSPVTRSASPACRPATTNSCGGCPVPPSSPATPTTSCAPSPRSPATDGADLVTTLDPALQQKAEDALSTLGEGAPAAALVAIRPSDGAVLASANGSGAAGADLAMTGQYAPGSTFKVVTSLALLRSGMGVDDVVSCPATTVVDGRSFKNYDDYPAVRAGRHHPDPGRRPVLQHGPHRQRRPARRRRAGCGGPGPRARHRPRPRVPGLLRPGPTSRHSDGRRRRHDRPGHRARQPLRDGHGRRVGPGRSGRAAGAAAGPPGRAGGAGQGRSPAPSPAPSAV